MRQAVLREHRPEDYITKIIPYDYRPEAKCLRWLKFLKETFQDDQELIGFMQRALGYCLTGVTREKLIFLAWGPKDTGKTTLLNTIFHLLGGLAPSSYAGRIKVESLMTNRTGIMDANAQSDLADLRAKRYIMTSETGEGQQFREELIKLLTQGQGEYRAVRKYENPFSFRESWIIWIDCNHLPLIVGTDDAIWVRLAVIPFRHVIPKTEQDRQLHEHLMAEAEGILAWMVKGCELWGAEGGLRLPQASLDVRQLWRGDMDELGKWLAEDCQTEAKAQTGSHALYSAYKGWAEGRKLFVMSETRFSLKMQERFKKETRHSGAFFQGARLLTPQERAERTKEVGTETADKCDKF